MSRIPPEIQARADEVLTKLSAGASPLAVGARRLINLSRCSYAGKFYVVDLGNRWRVMYPEAAPDRARVLSHEDYNKLIAQSSGARARIRAWAHRA